MATKILVVEDQYIEANDLRIMLEKAGHQVSGIAKSYDHARLLLERDRPDIVLLDIFLKGKLTGLDLASLLSKDNIPFIYLSANSNKSILEAAKMTRPFGFLVKPFRTQDVLVALDIAGYRHQHQTDLIVKQEKLLTTILTSILGDQSTAQNKLLRLAQAFKPYLPFDVVFIDTDMTHPDLNSLVSLRRTGFNTFETVTGMQLNNELNLNAEAYLAWRKKTASVQNILIENNDQFEESCLNEPFLRRLKNVSGMQSRIIVPLTTGSGVHMSVRFYSAATEAYTSDQLDLLNPLRALLSLVIENIGRQSSGKDTCQSNGSTGDLPVRPVQFGSIIGNSPKLLRALDQATQVANFDLSVLILGETGVGKEGLVQAIHQLSGRNKKPLIKINCAAIPALLIESELFGHEKGAFTGAYDRRIGKFEQAQGGTIFLDEIGELPLETQTKLLRVLQEKELERVGGRTTIKIDVRVIAATNRNLHKDVVEGRFRMDLFYRLNVFPIVLVPLRERKEDIPLLIAHFLQQHAAKTGSETKRLSSNVTEQLSNYSWPGNIRELLHVIERNAVLSSSNVIARIDLPAEVTTPVEAAQSLPVDAFQTIEEVDRAHIIAALRKCNGKVAGKGGAAEILNLPATTLNSRMKKLGISWKFIY